MSAACASATSRRGRARRAATTASPTSRPRASTARRRSAPCGACALSSRARATARPPTASSPPPPPARSRAAPTTSRRWASSTPSPSRSVRRPCARASTNSPPPAPTRPSSLRPKENPMKGDFSRDTFDKSRNYSGVLMQQGRVQLDADWNEQARIILHLLRALAADLFGPFGGPKPPGFRISDVKPKNGRLDFTISRGHYYVDGILCDAAADASYSDQPYSPWRAAAEPARFYLPDPPFLVYLDVWERFVSAVEDPSLREVALNGPDTAGRTQVVFQVKAVKIGQLTGAPTCQNFLTDTQTKGIWERLSLTRVPAGRLKARARRTTPADASDACAIPPEASYRGSDNRNYRGSWPRAG